MRLLPDEVVAVQVLRLHPRPSIQRRRRGQYRVRPDLRPVRVVVRHRHRPQEVVDDLQKVGLLEPDLSRGGAAAEEERAASRFVGEGAGFALWSGVRN